MTAATPTAPAAQGDEPEWTGNAPITWAPTGDSLPGEPEAIFVVGVARSGTTLMRKLLQTSERIGITPENHYVGHLVRRFGVRYILRGVGDMHDDAVVKKIVDMVYTGELQRRSRWRRLSPFWRWVPKNIERDEFERRLLASDRTERGFFAAMMRLHSDAIGRPLMGEKTPAHLGYVETLLEWFPNGRVIHTTRDPRAIYVSESYRRKVKGRPPYSWLAKIPLLLQSVVLIQTVLVYRGSRKRHEKLSKLYPMQYTLVRFEDVVTKPDSVLPDLFRFIGVAVPDFNTVVVKKTHGMRSSDEGLDPAAADRWRSRIRPFPKRFLELFLRGPMRAFGYTD